MTISEFRGPALTEEQWQQIKALATSLDAKQSLWVSGFFAGIVESRALFGDRVVAPPLEAPASGVRTLTVLYGSETGNSAALSRALAEQARARGLVAEVYDMASYKTRQLKDEQDLLIITSTYGEGDPPQPAMGFFEFVEGRKAPKLSGLRFAVLALGDSTYEHYCEAGKRLDRRLEALGAQRLKARVDCDVDYDEPAAAWTAEIVAALAEARTGEKKDHVSAGPAASTQAAPASSAIDKRNPFPARIIENIVLTGRGSSKETRHIELSLEGSGLTFEPGDALGIMPRNDPALAEKILSALGLAPSETILLKGKSIPLDEALLANLEITTLTPRFIEHWAKLSDAKVLKRLTQPGQAEERTAFASGHHVIDLIRQFPVKAIDGATFIAGLRPLQPRLYSIASSLAAVPEEVHLTVSTVRYDLHGERRSGVASGYLADRVELDGVLPVYVQASPHFRLPADEVPIIMIGAGTGVAPYRAFMQEREVRGAAGKSWLIFGERNFRTDFLYQTEWQTFLADGVLSRMDVAFSRDAQRGETGKVYVQHRLKEKAREIFAWLQEGAHLYVCGDANHLAPDVHAALAGIVASQGGLSPDAAEDYLRDLQNDARYQRDVY